MFFILLSTLFTISMVTISFARNITSEVPSLIIYSSNQKEFTHPNYYPQGTKVELKCVATGYPPPKYKWFHNDRLIPDNGWMSDGRIVLNEGNLTINQLNYKVDDGIYQCLATNKFGADVSEIIKFKTKVIGKFIETTEVETYTIEGGIIGEPLLVNCPKTTYFHPKIIYWGFQTPGGLIMPVYEDKRVNIFKNGTLFFGALLHQDVTNVNKRGGLHCAIYAGNEFRHSKAHLIQEYDGRLERQSLQKVLPWFAEKLSEEMKVDIGEKTFMHCVAFGRPTPEISWYHNDTAIKRHEGGYRVLYSGIMLEVEVDSTSKSGVYKCRASGFNNGEDVAISSEQKLLVDAKPRWVISPKDRYVVAGSVVYISCLASGAPTPYHQFFINGVQVNNNISTSIIAERFLKIENVTKSTDISCKATNVHGSAATNLTIYLIDPTVSKLSSMSYGVKLTSSLMVLMTSYVIINAL